MSLEAFEAAGHYDPADARAHERAELIEHLVERFGVEPVLDAAERVPLFTVAVELTDPAAPRVSAREVSEVSGLELEDVLLVRAAMGFPVVDEDAPEVPAGLIEQAGVIRLAAELFGREPTLAFTRVMGAAVQQISEAARALFANSVIDGADGAAVTELELSVSNEVAWGAWRALPPVVEQLMLERADSRQELVQAIVEGDLRVAVVFVDLVGSTAWTAAADPRRQAEALARFEQAAWEVSVGDGGRLVKLIGDEAMIVAQDVAPACRMAQALCRLAAADPDLPEARGGVAYGEVTARGGDYFGPVVNLAARILGQAAPGEVLVTEPTAALLDPEGWTLDPVGPIELRGIAEPVSLFRLSPVLGRPTAR
jgi:adenylate cyclase